MYSALIKLISSIVPLNNKDIAYITSLFELCDIAKNKILINQGEVSDKVYYTVSGYLRYYKIMDTGEEQTIHLISPGHFGASYASFMSGEKSEEVLETVTDSCLLSITREKLEQLFDSDVKFQKFGRVLMEINLLEKEKRIVDQISLTAQQRYEKLITTDPQLVQHVPIQYIASFIGIKPESLSRIRKQIFLTNVK